MGDLLNQSTINAAKENTLELIESDGNNGLRDRLSLSSGDHEQKQSSISLLVLYYSIPAGVLTLVAYECVYSLWLRNQLAWIYLIGIHAIILIMFWYFAIRVAGIEHDDSSRRRMIITGVALGLIYLGSAALSWIMVALAVMPV